MGIYETFSKRQKKLERAGQPDVYQYDDIPNPLRVQVIHIWRTMRAQLRTKVNPYFPDKVPAPEQVWTVIENAMARELGVLQLGKWANDSQNCEEFLLSSETSHVLDLIEISFVYFVGLIREFVDDAAADSAVAELNHRFREHGVGYQFEGKELIRVDSQYIHSDAVKPAISLLRHQDFAGASEEFHRAHEHFRHGRNKEAIAEANKAFESTMKAICDLHGWTYAPNVTAKELIATLFRQGLIPQWMETHFAGLRNTLDAGLPTVRNKTSGHGQGSIPVLVPDHLASYALHLVATNIVFLVEANEAMK